MTSAVCFDIQHHLQLKLQAQPDSSSFIKVEIEQFLSLVTHSQINGGLDFKWIILKCTVCFGAKSADPSSGFMYRINALLGGKPPPQFQVCFS